jgi:hypothetical protein
VSEQLGTSESDFGAASNVAVFSVVDCLFKEKDTRLGQRDNCLPPCTARTRAARCALRVNHARAPLPLEFHY